VLAWRPRGLPSPRASTSGTLPVQGKASGCRVQGVRCRVLGAGCRVQGAGFKVQNAPPAVDLLLLSVPLDTGPRKPPSLKLSDTHVIL